jgi:hypothetical protein
VQYGNRCIVQINKNYGHLALAIKDAMVVPALLTINTLVPVIVTEALGFPVVFVAHKTFPKPSYRTKFPSAFIAA